MTVKDFLENPITAQIVKSSLGQKVTLPSEGFVAGGSVANMLLSLYHKGTPWLFQINDIDIFQPIDSTEYESGYAYDGEGENMLVGNINLGMSIQMDEGYGHVFVERDGTYYKVLDTERDGLFNYVKCFVNHGNSHGGQIRYTPEPPQEDPERPMFPVSQNLTNMPNIDPDNDIILRGFDLNCCQAGIDLKNGKLHYTESFEKFLKSKQVLVDIPYTPFHTAIRLVKKMSMYGDFCYCDMDYEMRYLKQALRSDESCRFFGKETYDKFVDNKECHEYFKVTMVDVKNMPYDYRKKYFPNYNPNKNTGNGLFGYDDDPNVEGRELWTYQFKKEYKDIPYEFNYMWELKKIWDYKYRFMKKSHQNKIDLVMNFNKEESKPKAGKIQNLFYTLQHQGGPEYSFPFQCLVANDKYYDCDFTMEHLKEINDFVREHRMLSGMLSRTNNIQEQYNNVKMLKALSNKEGQWIIGTLETLGREESIQGREITKEWVQSLIEKEKLRMSKPLVEAYNLDNFKYSKYVTELTTPLQLKREGDMMGHCVGGYSYSIEKGESRIFHIEVDGIGSTLEIGLKKWNDYLFDFDTEDNRKKFEEEERKPKQCFKVNQHYGRYPIKKGNQIPTNRNRGIAFKLIHFLYKQELSDQQYKDMFKLEDVRRSRTTPTKKKNIWWKYLKDSHAGKNSLRKSKKNTGIFNDVFNDIGF
jgi:hypothetical protein